jgi:RNA polymerase sigma factor (sigma-70 family)
MKESTPDPATGDRWLTWYREAKNGNQEVKTQLIGELRPFLLAVVKKQSSGQMFGAWDSSDVVQDCFVKLFSLPAEQEFRGTTGLEFIAWLRTIAQREWLDGVRLASAQKRGGGQVIGRLPGESNGEIAIAADTSTPSKAMMRQEEKRQFEAFLAQLSDKYQRVVRLRCSAEKLTWGQIAEQLGESEDTVKQWFHRATEQLSNLRREQS